MDKLHKEHEFVQKVWKFIKSCEEKQPHDDAFWDWAYSQAKHEFPLIDKGLVKEDVHGLFERLFSFERPMMYELGYPNNNCIGCIKGGMGYWNKIRKDFPDVFKARAELERKVNHSILKECYLDELEEGRGNMNTEIFPDCGIMCYLSQ